MKAKGVIFDCDGVLVDSEVYYLKSLLSYLSSKQIQANLEDVIGVLGMSPSNINRYLRQRYPLEQYTDDELLEGPRKKMRLLMLENPFQPMPYLKQFMNDCRDSGLKIAVASSSGKNYVNSIINQIGVADLIDVVVPGESVVFGKPAPDIYLLACKILEVTPEEAIAIEDSPNGIKSAKSAGLFTIAYKGSKIAQCTDDADMTIDSYNTSLQTILSKSDGLKRETNKSVE